MLFLTRFEEISSNITHKERIKTNLLVIQAFLEKIVERQRGFFFWSFFVGDGASGDFTVLSLMDPPFGS